MKVIKTLVFVFLSAFGINAMAGGNHSHAPVGEEKASTMATQLVNNLVQQNVIVKSWSNVEIVEIEQKEFNGNMEWVSSFYNPEVADKSKQTLYIFMTLSGEYLAANYTGK